MVSGPSCYRSVVLVVELYFFPCSSAMDFEHCKANADALLKTSPRADGLHIHTARIVLADLQSCGTEDQDAQRYMVRVRTYLLCCALRVFVTNRVLALRAARQKVHRPVPIYVQIGGLSIWVAS